MRHRRGANRGRARRRAPDGRRADARSARRASIERRDVVGERRADRGRLEPALVELAIGIRIDDDAAAGVVLEHAVAHDAGADGQTELAVPTWIEEPDRAGV